jgi:hypothetical protein
MNQSEKPMEVPFPPKKPEIKPTEEPPVKIWPVKVPEIIPGKDPERPTTIDTN